MTTRATSSIRTKQLATQLGQNIAHFRRARGWTQQEFGERVGIGSVTVSRLETGASIPSLLRLAEIAEALNVSLAELVGGVSPNVNDQVSEITACLTQVEEVDRYFLVDMVKRMTARILRRS